MAPANANPEPADPRARLLFRLVGELKVRFGYERSFRVCRGALLPNRFLMSISKESVAPEPRERILDLCQRLNMPEGALEAAGRHLSAVRFVHFGFEENETTCLYKVYLEFRTPAGGPDGPSPVLLHLAFKWDASRPARCVLTRYVWHPWLSLQDILAGLSEVYGGRRGEEPFDIARGVLEVAAGRIPHQGVRYLEVTEDDNSRRSFDLNLCDANLLVSDLYPYLLRMCRHYAIAFDQFQALYDRIRSRTVGHLAGGVHREGEDFFNLYYGVEARQG